MEIILLRHGPPDFKAELVKRKKRIKASLDTYANSRVSSVPPDHVVESVSDVNACVTSTLPRALDSAELLGFENCIAMEQFKEAGLPHPEYLPVSMPWNLFLLIYRVGWYFGYSRNCAGRKKDLARVREGGVYLSKLASESGRVLLVGHGVINWMLCKELRGLGWSVSRKSGNGYWSYVSLTS